MACVAGDEVTVHSAPLREVDPATLYRILQLRVDVFVVEQNCVYRELDGRDLAPDAVLVWAQRGGDVVATLRLFGEPDGSVRIGRVATSAGARGGGLAQALMQRALELAGGREVLLDAQSYLVEWYEHFGFAPVGDEYLDDGIPHVPMRRPPGSA
jgi:ElaA protein